MLLSAEHQVFIFHNLLAPGAKEDLGARLLPPSYMEIRSSIIRHIYENICAEMGTIFTGAALSGTLYKLTLVTI